MSAVISSSCLILKHTVPGSPVVSAVGRERKEWLDRLGPGYRLVFCARFLRKRARQEQLTLAHTELSARSITCIYKHLVEDENQLFPLDPH
jgi:hypothetical protein